MGLLADFAKLNTAVNSYAKALDTAYAAAVKQLQVTDELEKKSRSAALAMAESATKAEAAAAKMAEVSKSTAMSAYDLQKAGQSAGSNSYNPYNASRYLDSKYIANQVLGGMKSSSFSFVDSNEAKLTGLTDELIDSNESVKQAYKAFANFKLDIGDKGRLYYDMQVKYESMKKEGYDKTTIDGTIKIMNEQLTKLRGEYDSRLNALKGTVDAALKPERDALAADWRSAVTEFAQKVGTNDIQGTTQTDDLRLEALAKKLVEAIMSGANAKTYTIQLNGNDIRTIDDPTDLIKLIEELSKAKRLAG
jgi:hypothetical protein